PPPAAAAVDDVEQVAPGMDLQLAPGSGDHLDGGALLERRRVDADHRAVVAVEAVPDPAVLGRAEVVARSGGLDARHDLGGAPVDEGELPPGRAPPPGGPPL